jgi:catechol 2,3-dioxygenase-like lactoylglutathione lyase family enzyme
MLKLDHINIQTMKLAETVAFYRDVLELRAGDPPPPLDPAEEAVDVRP